MSKPASPALIRKLAIEWPNVEAGLGEIDISAYEQIRRTPSEKARLAHASQILRRPVATFNDLSMSEALRLLSVYKEATGEEFKPAGVGYQGARRRGTPWRARTSASPDELLKLGEIAVELWHAEGEDWFQLLCARVMQRFRVANPQSLMPGQARSMVEELLQRIAVRECRKRHVPPITREEIEAEKEVWRRKFFRPQMAQISPITPIESAEKAE
jgi:hypothetical protein